MENDWRGNLNPDEYERSQCAIDMDAEQAQCPACATPFKPTDLRCPGCGLRFG